MDKQLNEKISKMMAGVGLFCAYLVVLIHTYNVSDYSITQGLTFEVEFFVSENLARIAVPFFFFSSGYFQFWREKKYTMVLVSKIRTLVIPYIIWNCIGMLLFAFLGCVGLSNIRVNLTDINSIFNGVFLYKYNYAYWFMYQLILLNIFYPIISIIMSKKKVALIIWFGLLYIYLLFGDIIPSAKFYTIMLSALIYYCLGGYISKYQNNILEYIADKKNHNSVRLLELVITLVFIGGYLINRFPEWGFSENYNIIRNIAGIFMLLMGASLIEDRVNKINRSFGFIVYSMHPVLLECIQKIVMRIFGSYKYTPILDYIFSPIITILIIKIVSDKWKKYNLKTYNLAFGYRE